MALVFRHPESDYTPQPDKESAVVVDITRDRNPNLIEKAGREGFRENRAYRQLKCLLENLLVQLAADFFRKGGSRADQFMDRRAELVRNERLRRKRAVNLRHRAGGTQRQRKTLILDCSGLESLPRSMQHRT